MQVADMEHCEAVEPAWQCLECKIVMVDPDALRVSYATPIQAGQLQRCSNDGMDRVPVLDVEKIDALAKNLSAIRKGFRRKWTVWDQEKTASFLYPWVGMESWTMHP